MLYRPDHTYRSPRWLRKILVVVAIVQIPSLLLAHSSGPIVWISILGESSLPLSWRLPLGAYLVLPISLLWWAFSRPRGQQGSLPENRNLERLQLCLDVVRLTDG